MNDPNAAGLRTSNSNPSLRVISNRTASTRSIVSHLGSYRHALLKSHAQQPPSIKQELPVPPVLTHSHPNSANKNSPQDSATQRPASRTPTPIENTTRPIELVTLPSAGTGTREASENEPHHLCEDHDTPHDNHRISGLHVSKVRPAVYDAEEDGNHRPEGEVTPESPVLVGALYPTADHFLRSRMYTPKVRPFTDFQSMQPSYPHEGHYQAIKVRPYFDTSNLSNETAEIPILEVTGQTSPRDGEESRKVPKYWGLLPRFRDRRTQERFGIFEQEGRENMPGPRGRRSLTSVQSTSLQPGSKQENLRTEDQSHERNSTTSNDQNQIEGVPGVSEERDGKANASTPPLSREQNSPLPDEADTGWTTGWLRGLLGYSDAESANLTRLPKKALPQEQSQDEISSITSKVTTYSSKNAVDKKAMSNAMRSLENLITEALSLANEAGKPDRGHLDDGGLPLNPTSEDSTRALSIDEIQMSSGALPDIMSGNGTKANRKSGISPLGSRNDQIPRLFFFRRKRKTTSNTEPQHHTPYDNCRDSNNASVIIPESEGIPNKRDSKEHTRTFHQLPICTRSSSKISFEENKESSDDDADPCLTNRFFECQDLSVHSLDGGTSDDAVDFSVQSGTGERQHGGSARFRGASRSDKYEKPTTNSRKLPEWRGKPTGYAHELRNISLRNRSHISIGEGQLLSFSRSARRQPTIARDWSPARKQFVAAIACISTALIGMLVGIYAGLVPSIQYYIADMYHYTILGNVGLYLGMALPTLFLWPLPLLHGRKPYIVSGLCIAMPLLFPQAIAISAPRSPYTCVWRVALLLSRALMGFSLGLASMNFHSVLTDLFGASLMSQNPHQEIVDDYDCFIGSLSIGFVIGALVIESLQPSWGLYISIILIAIVLLLNRRSVAELRTGDKVSRRLARGEIMMHRVQTGPRWWGQEVYHGIALSLEMLRQPGFLIMAVYSAWIYAQIVLIIVLLGSLTSKSYRFRSPYVAAVVSSVAIGAFAAIPFQKANFFSRARNMSPMSNLVTFEKTITWSSHLIRRAIFTLFLPIAGIVYTVISDGPPVHIFFPSFLAALIGFLSCLAISECNGMLMETWDCSDLQPGMTGRSKSSKDSHKRTNYSSFPRVTAGWNFTQGLGFIFAAGATSLGGLVTRRLGQKAATGVVAGILFILTLLLLGAVTRFKKVQIIPNCTCSEMDRWKKERRVSLHNWAAAMAAAKESGSKALQEIPEDLGSLTRWTEIRKKNKLIDQSAHLNRQAVALARDELQHSARHSMQRIMHKVSKSLESKCSHESSDDEFPDVGKIDANPTSSPQPEWAFPERTGVADRMTSEGNGSSAKINVGSNDTRRSGSPSRSHASGPGFEAQPVNGQSSGIDDATVSEGLHEQSDVPVESKTEGINEPDHDGPTPANESPTEARPAEASCEEEQLDDSEKKASS
ncbi:hypothetical protein F4861DRAFT_531580 [Xylaria intraflava]|nr:hypothetical protein F4861DRAFT_531580 [Xylaria intraflava]